MDSDNEIVVLRRTWHRRSVVFVVVGLVVPGLAIFFQNQLENGLAPFPVPLVWVSLCFIAAIRAAISMKRLRDALLSKDQSFD